MTMRVLAIDPSLTCTGWAATDGKYLEAGTKRFLITKGRAAILRYEDFRYWLSEALELHQPELVVYEAPGRYSSRAANEAGYGLSVILQVAVAKAGIRVECIAPISLKLYATGSGNADKAAMKAHAAHRWAEYDPSTDKGGDEADARWLLQWGLEGCLRPEPKRKKKARNGGE